MSARTPREEAAGIARAARRLLERERARGAGELVASGVAKARGRKRDPKPGSAFTMSEPPATQMGFTPAEPAPKAPADFALAEPAPAQAGFTLTPPPAPPPRVPAPAVVDDPVIELPAFADDLHPSGAAGGRDAIVEASQPVLEAIAAEARACEKCGLCRTRTQAVPGTGSARSGIVFVGEAPGADEDARGEPFVGRAGELLTKMIAAMDERRLIPGVRLDRSTVYIANVLKCRPPDNRNPLPNEIEQCSPYLIRQLEALRPRIICCLGKFAAELLCGIKGTVGSMRGRTYRWRGAKLVVTYHPAYLLRNPRPDGPKREVWNDLQRLAQEYLTD